MLIGGLLALFPALGLAENEKHSFEVGAFGSYVHFDPQTDIDSDFSVSILAGFHFTKRHSLEFGFSSLTASPDTEGFPITINTERLGYVFNAYPRAKFVSLFRVGVGRQGEDARSPNSGGERFDGPSRDLLIYGGGGFRYFFTPWIGLRIDGTFDFIEGDDGFISPEVQGIGNIGFIFLVGGKEAS